MTQDEQKPTLLIADDHPVFAEGLAESLKDDYTVVGMATTLKRLPVVVARSRPDVLVLDLSFHGTSALPALRRINARLKRPPAVVVLTAHSSRATAKAAEEAGALAFLSKDVSTQELKLAIGAALEGRRYVRSVDLAERKHPGPQSPHNRRVTIDGYALTKRQVQILSLLVSGTSRSDIAAQLGYSIKGIDYHLQRIKHAVGVRTVRLLYVWATEHAEALGQTAAVPPDGQGGI